MSSCIYVISCREYLDLSKKKNTEFFFCFFEKKMTSVRFKIKGNYF